MPERCPPPPSPPLREVLGPSSALWILGVGLHTMMRRNVTYPPYRALPPWTPFRRGQHGRLPVPRGRWNTWGQQTCPWMAWYDPAPALRLWLGHVTRSLPVGLPRTEGSLERVTCMLHVLGALLPRQLSLEDILMGCFLYWTATGADSQWVLSALQRVPQGLAIAWATIHKAYCLRYGDGAPLWRPPACTEAKEWSRTRWPRY